MDRAEDRPDELFDRLMYSELGQQMHLSTDLIIADLLDELSPQSRSKVAAHMAICRDCAEVRELAKKALAAEPMSDEENPAPMSPKILDAETRPRVELIAVLNAKRPILIDKMVKALAPETPEAITFDQRDYLGVPTDDPASASQAHGQGRVGSVREVVNFVLLLQDLIAERCKDLAHLIRTLPECVDEAMVMLGVAGGSEQTKNKVIKVLSEVFSEGG